MKDEELDRVVLQYLRKRRFVNAERILRQECGLNEAVGEAGEREVPFHLDSRSGVAEHVLFYTAAEKDPAAYLHSYERLCAWVDNSLEMYRYELSKVLYPLFVHCYLELVANGASSHAHKLLARAKRRFRGVASGARATGGRAQELQDLQSVSVPQHLSTNKTALSARRSRYPLAMSSASFGLLMAFLQEQRLYLLLHLANERLRFQITEGPPVMYGDASADEGVLLAVGQVGGDMAAANSQPLQLGLLEGNLEDELAQEQQAEEEGEGLVPEVDDEGKKLTKKAKKALEQGKEARKQELAAARAARVKSSIPLPVPTDEARAAALAEMRNRVAVGPSALPSAAFFTFFNTHHSLNAAAISQDASMVAGAFSDSSVRLYNMRMMMTGDSGFPEAPDRGAGDAAQPMDVDGVAGMAAGPSSLQAGEWDEEDGDGSAELRSGSVAHLHGHTAGVYCVDFSPRRDFVFSGSADGTVRMWNPETRYRVGGSAGCLVVYRGHHLPVWDVSCSDSGFYFASCGADRTARVWSTERGHALRILAGHQSDVEALRWHPNCHYLASGSADRTVRLWDVQSGACVRMLVGGHRATVTALAFSPDGLQLASADAEGCVSLWDLGSAGQVASAQQHAGPVWSLDFSRGEGSLLASGGADCAIRLWDAKSAGASPVAGSATATAAAGASQQAALPLVATWPTRATPVYAVRFSTCNLLTAAGAFTVRPRRGGGVSGGPAGVAQ